MKDAKRLLGVAGKFIVALIVIMAFIRGDVKVYFYAGWMFVLAGWLIAKIVIPALKPCVAEIKQSRQAKKIAEQEKEAVKQEKQTAHSEDAIDVNLFIIHINRRITEYLKGSFPNATWQWCNENPEKGILKYEAQRIKIFDCGEFTHAEICFDRCANLSCQLIKMMPLNGAAKPETDAAPTSEKTEMDPRVWFEQSGKEAISKIIKDFQSRGHNSMTITEDGDCLVIHGNNALKYSTIADMPKKTLWTTLIDVFESEGIAASVGVHGLDLVW